MTTYYSPSKNAFYESEINTSIPEDVLEITEKKKQELLSGQAKGLVITPDVSGNPILKGDLDNLENKLEIIWRNSELVKADIELNKVQDSDPKAVGTVSQWREYRKALRGWPENSNFPNKEFRPKAPDYKE